LNEREIVTELIDPGIVARRETDEDVRVVGDG